MTILLINAKIYSLDPDKPTSSALAIDNGRILGLGDDYSILTEFEGKGEIVNLAGRSVIPGLIDAHIHLEQLALLLDKLNCETSSLSDCLQRVADRASSVSPGEWILGNGWNQNDWKDHQEFPTADDLNTVAPDNPVYLTAKSLHVGWANTAALSAVGITDNYPDPTGGRLGRKLDGSPDGILFEEAMALVSPAIPEPTHDRLYQAMRTVQENLWSMGITSVHDFDRQRCFQILQSLHANHELKLRVIKSIPLEDLDYAVALGLNTGFGDNFLRIGSIKVFSDGALGPRTASMLSPYQGEPQNHGMLLLDSEELFKHGCKAVENNLSLAVHAIGDRANHETLNAFAQLRLLENQLQSKSPSRSQFLRHRIEHVQIIHPHDALRMGQLGVIASMQPVHATSDFPAADRYWGDRSANAYAWNTLLQSRTPLAFGSDAPVESPNPFWGIHAAVTRRRQDGSPGPNGWYPEQRLTLPDALHAYTTGAAFAARMEKYLGTLTPGYLADLLVLDEDPFITDIDNLFTLKPIGTMVNGEWVLRNFD